MALKALLTFAWQVAAGVYVRIVRISLARNLWRIHGIRELHFPRFGSRMINMGLSNHPVVPNTAEKVGKFEIRPISLPIAPHRHPVGCPAHIDINARGCFDAMFPMQSQWVASSALPRRV